MLKQDKFIYLFLQITQGHEHTQHAFLILFSPQQTSCELSWAERQQLTQRHSADTAKVGLELMASCFLAYCLNHKIKLALRQMHSTIKLCKTNQTCKRKKLIDTY